MSADSPASDAPDTIVLVHSVIRGESWEEVAGYALE